MTTDAPDERCPRCGGTMRLDRDPNTPLGDVLICNDCQRVVTRFGEGWPG